MSDQNAYETAWNVVSSTPKTATAVHFPHSTAAPKKRSMRQRPHQLAHDIRAICRRNPQGAHRAQADRLRTLLLCAKQLGGRKKAVNLDADDIRLLVGIWHADKLAASTIRFRLVCLRWLARKIAKSGLVGSDRAYAVDRRTK